MWMSGSKGLALVKKWGALKPHSKPKAVICGGGGHHWAKGHMHNLVVEVWNLAILMWCIISMNFHFNLMLHYNNSAGSSISGGASFNLLRWQEVAYTHCVHLLWPHSIVNDHDHPHPQCQWQPPPQHQWQWWWWPTPPAMTRRTPWWWWQWQWWWWTITTMTTACQW